MNKVPYNKLLIIIVTIIISLIYYNYANSTTVVGVAVPEGIVLAGDSRVTFVSNSIIRIASDRAQKVFQLNKNTGAVSYGAAILLDKNINSLIEEFKAKNPKIDTLPVDIIVKELKTYFDDIYRKQLARYPNIAIDQLGFMVAGYDENGNGKLLAFSVPNGIIEGGLSTNGSFGASWHGQTDVIVRLIQGCCPELANKINQNINSSELKPESKINPFQFEYIMNFNYMTIQDAIDFADFLIRTTIETQRFSYFTMSSSTTISSVTIPGVGGQIDIAVITPTGFKWIRKKEIHAP